MLPGIPDTIEGEFPDTCPLALGHEPRTVAIVIGSAPERNADVIEISSLVSANEADVIAVNHAGIDVEGHLHHWVSIHGNFLLDGLGRRAALGLPPPSVAAVGCFTGCGERRPPGVAHWKVNPYGGSSSLFAVRWALFWGYRRIVLCGCGLTGRGTVRCDGAIERDENGYERYRSGWLTAMENGLRLTEHVRSMSGWTQSLFGAPSQAFLAPRLA